MGIEIERKFLVADSGWRELVKRTERLRQGYLTSGSGVTVRVRTVDDDKGFITIKSGGSALARAEFEYEVPVADARQMLGYCRGAQIEKVRHSLELEGGDWVVDEFRGRHDGLVLAEVELESPNAKLDKPSWLGDEVTGDPQYYNSSLAALPSGGEI
jgi:CYTH domain-containing protein